MKEALTNLLKIKSLVTLALTLTVVILVLRNMSIPQPLIDIYLMVIGFYFGTQTKGNNNDNTTL